MDLALEPNRYRRDHEHMRSRVLSVEPKCATELRQFRSHSLAEQVAVDLADRTDSKYLMPIAVLPRLLQEVTGEHSVLEAAGQRVFTYQNTYFDTPHWDLYKQHHNGKLNRHKCRFRRYQETDISYLEIKFKSNKQRTVKNRMPWRGNEHPLSVPGDAPVQPRLYINYRRITLWNRSTNERLTLDFDLIYQRPGKVQVVRLENFFIAELKRQGKVYGSPFVRRAKHHGYKPQPMSKYCVGVCLTDDGELKQNRFKPLLRRLQRFESNGEFVL